MSITSRWPVVLVVIAFNACATDSTARDKETTPSASTDSVDAGAANPAPAMETGEGVPPPGPADQAWVSLDMRGAFGPIVASHFDVFPDGSALCFRRRAAKPDERNRVTLNEEQLRNLKAALEKAQLPSARAVARGPIIQDIGTVTLAQREAGKDTVVVIDGRNTVNPPQSELQAVLGALMHACLGETGGAP